MNESWYKFLTEQGAVIENGRVTSLASIKTNNFQLDETYLCDLSNLGVIHAYGNEAQSFLQSQFTNDLNQVSNDTSQLSSYCNPKGRILSIFRIYKADDSYFLVLPRDVLALTLQKLTMYKLMSKVEFADESDDRIVFGIAGPETSSVLKKLNLSIPEKENDCIQVNETTVIKISEEYTRILFICNEIKAVSLCKKIIKEIPIATSALWDLHDIQNGIAQITANTSEAFIPQMVNLEIIGGVNFQKGCYPGQEVVARTHYLGKPNRRMYKISIEGENTPEAGTNIFSAEDDNQPVGKVVTAQKNSNNSSAALIVLRTAKKDEKNLRIDSISDHKITVQTLPYSVDVGEK